MFAAVAVTPTLIVSIFSAVFFDFGLRGWFSERVATAVNSATAVAGAYLEEHRQTIRGDALAMANDLQREAPFRSEEHTSELQSLMRIWYALSLSKKQQSTA